MRGGLAGGAGVRRRRCEESGSDLDLDPALVGGIAELSGIFLADLVGNVEIQLDRGAGFFDDFQENADAELAFEYRFFAEGHSGRENGSGQDGVIVFEQGHGEKIVFQVGDMVAVRHLEAELDGALVVQGTGADERTR